MSQEAATQLLKKMENDEWYGDIMQYYMYYINLLKRVVEGKPMSKENYETLIKELKSDISDTRKTYRDEAATLLEYLLALHII